MKHLAIRLVVSLLTFAIGIASAALLSPFRSNTVSNSKEEQAILEVERQYIQANLNADTETLEEILADDFTVRNCRAVVSKEEILALLESPDFAYEDIDTGDVEVKVNGDRAVLKGVAAIKTRYGDKVTRSSYAFKRIYEKRQGRWQIVSVRTDR